MIPASYLKGIDADDSDIPGVYGVAHSRQPGSWRLLCSYADGQRFKSRIFAKLASGGQRETKGSWDFHHVVEGQHFADIDFQDRLPALYADSLPCVLISKEEHRAYNSLLHIRETDELYRESGLPKAIARRSAETTAAAADPRNHARLLIRVQELRRLYDRAYDGDPVLQTVARNVLKDALNSLP